MREYFVDQEKYFYLILLHLNAAFCVGAISLTAIGAQYLKSPGKYIDKYRNRYKNFVYELYFAY